MASYRSLLAWQRAHELLLLAYDLTKCFPQDERFALTDQLRRAALSTPANIVEGQAFGYSRPFIRHLTIAQGSLSETRYLLMVARDLGYLSPGDYGRAEALAEEDSRLLTGLRQSVEEALAEPAKPVRPGQEAAARTRSEPSGGQPRDAAVSRPRLTTDH